MKIGSKGISPLVATVLLIGVTMSIAALLAYWASSFTRSNLPTQNETQSLQSCTAADFQIFWQKYDPDSSTLKLVLQNTGGSDITITNITFIYPDGTIETKSINRILKEGSISQPPITVNNVTSGYESYTIFTNCPSVFRRSS